MYKKKKRKKNNDGGLYDFLIVALFLWMLQAKNPELKRIIIIAVALLIITVVICRIIRHLIKRKRLLNSRIHEIDKMSGVEFEELLAAHFRKLGYKVKLTPKSNDYGADLILKKEGEVVAVQAKRYREKVGIAAIQQVYSSMQHYNANRCMVITNSFYTSSALNLANENDVELWDREKLTDTFKIEK